MKRRSFLAAAVAAAFAPHVPAAAQPASSLAQEVLNYEALQRAVQATAITGTGAYVVFVHPCWYDDIKAHSGDPHLCEGFEVHYLDGPSSFHDQR